MGFINRAPKQQEQVKELTVEQKGKICDLYAGGDNYVAIKHAMREDFPAGEGYGGVIRGAINKMNAIQAKCSEIMQEGETKTKTALETKAAEAYLDCDKDCLTGLINKIVSATGTFEEYKKSFKQELPI